MKKRTYHERESERKREPETKRNHDSTQVRNESKSRKDEERTMRTKMCVRSKLKIKNLQKNNELHFEVFQAAFDEFPDAFSSCPFCRHQNLPQTRSRCLAVSTPHPASRSTFVRPPVRPTSQSVYLSLRQTSPSAIHPIIQFDTTDPSTIKTEKKQNSHNFVPFQSLLVVGTRPPKTARLTSLTIRDWLGLPPQQQQPQEQQQQHHLRGVAQKRHGSVSIFLLPRFSGC